MSLIYTIAAIPTVYNGRQYRSRLEAKWASFFDLCGWPFEYEPFDLGEWSPDFLIRMNGKDLLIEVKPLRDIDVPTIYKMHKAATATGFAGDLLLVGLIPFKGEFQQPYIGWICSNETPVTAPSGRERRDYPLEMQLTPWFTHAEVVLVDGKQDIIMPYPYGATRGGTPYCTGLFSGVSMGEDYTWGGERMPYVGASDFWAKATNAVQWHPK